LKKRFAAAMATALALFTISMTGCGIVKVVKIGEEATLTGETVFDAGAESQGSWGAIVEEITGNAQEISAADFDVTSGAFPISATGKIISVDQESKKGTLTVELDGYSGDKTFKIQIGPVYSGTSVRDAQTQKIYSDFTNQGEWSEYALALNDLVNTNVVTPLALDSSAAGKTITLVGVYSASATSTITITPVSMSIS
jgi:predicted lipoprotein